MNQVKLLHIVGGSGFGGAAKLILRLAQRMQSDGWHVDILTTDPLFQEAAERQGIGVIAIDVIRREIRPWWDLRGLFRLYRFLRRNDYLAVHTHTSKAGFVGRLAAWLAGVPVILHTVHGFAFHERSPRTLRMSYSWLERLAARWCDRIVAVTEFHRRWALELGICGPKKIVAIPNGIAALPPTSQKTVDEIRCRWGVQPEELAVLTPGRLAHEKGLEDLLAAAAILKDRGLPFRWILAGDGPLRRQLETLAQARGVADRFLFLGHREDVADLLAACDIVVLPSVREGLSIALLEAMASRKPIVATRIGGNLAVVSHEETALLVATGDARALSEAVFRCRRDPALREKLVANAVKRWESYYTEGRMFSAYRELYLDLIREKQAIGPKLIQESVGVPERVSS